MWIFEVVSLRIDMDNYLAPMWRICSYKFQFAWMHLLIIFWILYMRVFLGMCFLIFRSLYHHGNHLLQVTLITSDCVTIGSYQESCLKYHAQFLYLVICFLLWLWSWISMQATLGKLFPIFLVLGQWVIYGRICWSYSLWP